MSNLGGSPLGLIGVKSRPTADGMSTFNGGRSRNVNVNLYNSGKEANKEKLSKSGLNSKGGAFSLFSGDNFIQPWGNISQKGNDEKLNIGQDPYPGVSRRTLHNNDIYDTSIINLVDKTANTAAQLRPADFAYLKNLGVFPNNRLMIARRFASPAPDDIYGFKSRPIAVLISWKPTGEDFLDISFGEEWIDALADFTPVLNSMGEDFLRTKQVGDVLGAAFGAVPLPGWSEGLIQNILAKLGVLDPTVTERPLPTGNANLIREAKRRKTLKYGEAGSGLTCKVSIKMTCEYEQKFISGIDPTIAYMDILSNITRFGTSPRVDYGLSKEFATKIKSWVNSPDLLISEIVDGLTEGISKTIVDVKKALNIPTGEGAEKKEAENAKQFKEKLNTFIGDDGWEGLVKKISDSFGESLKKTVQKYREEIFGIANALTLSPSTPWHITLGNPLRPTFCSGDMYTSEVQLTLGPNLAFNDLPSSIKIEFTLINARNWGLQDIMAKFNTGHLRTVNVVADAASLNPNQSLKQGAYYFPGVTTSTTGAAVAGNPGGNPGSVTGGGVSSTGGNTTVPASTTKENESQPKLNSDPNSNKPVVVDETQKKTGGTVPVVPAPVVVPPTEAEKANKQGDSQQDPTADANATSKRGYTYEIVNVGMGKKFVKVKDKNGVEVLNGPATATTDITLMIDEAKTSLNDK